MVIIGYVVNAEIILININADRSFLFRSRFCLIVPIHAASSHHKFSYFTVYFNFHCIVHITFLNKNFFFFSTSALLRNTDESFLWYCNVKFSFLFDLPSICLAPLQGLLISHVVCSRQFLLQAE